MRDAEPIPEAMGSVSEVLLEYEDLPADLAWDPHQHGWDRRFALEEEYCAWADEYPYTHFNYWGAEEEDVLAEKVYQKFLALVSPSIMAEQISSVLPARKNSQRRKSSGKDIESRLFQFLTMLEKPLTHEVMLEAEVQSAIGDPRHAVIVNKYGQTIGSRFLAVRILLLAPFWIRSPSSWDPAECPRLEEFLFCEYQVPLFLERQWENNSTVLHPLKWISWYIILGQGGSLKKAARQQEWQIASRAIPFLFDVPKSWSPGDACLFAEIRRLGGGLREVSRLLQIDEFRFDPTERADSEFLRFWQSTVQWVIRVGEELSDADCHTVLRWARAEHRLADADFRLTGRSARAALERAEEHFYNESEAGRLRLKWNIQGWDYAVEDPLLGSCVFAELTTGRELAKEGADQSHCVFSYAGRCFQGFSAIFSLKVNGQSTLTIEVQPSSGKILQVRGKFNRAPSIKERQLVSNWHETVVQPRKLVGS